MKITYVNTLGVWGGVATYLESLIEDQIGRGNHVSLIVGNNGELTEYVKKNFPSVKVFIIDTMKREIDIIGICKSIFKMRKIIKTINPDIIQFNCIMAGLIGRLSDIGLKNKVIYNAHGWAFEPGTSKKFKIPAIIIEKFLSYFTNKIICVSNYELNIATKYHIFSKKNQPVVIKNGSKDYFKNYNNFYSDDGVFRITMAARFWDQKNQLDLIKGFKLLLNNNLGKKCLLYLLGDGPNLQLCKDFVKNNNLEDFVIFTGQVSNVHYYYDISDVVALITNYDAIAISLIEALSMGKPLIASNVSGVPENFLYNKNGFCIKNDPIIIYKYLNIMLNNNNLLISMGNYSRKLYLKEFTNKKNVESHNNLYQNLFRRKNY